MLGDLSAQRSRHSSRPRAIGGWSLSLLLLLISSHAVRGQTPSAKAAPKEQSEQQWVSEHVSLVLLPSAYVLRKGRFAVGGPVNMTPAGFPASTYSLYPNLVYGLSQRTEVAFGVTGAERLGPGGQAIFYNLGLQHLLIPETRRRPAVSVGGYGFLGPHSHNGGAAYVVASRQFTPHASPRGVFGHLGLELQSFTNSDSSTAVQPFIGANYVWTRRLRFAAEFRPHMVWEDTNLYSLQAIVLVKKRFGVSGGLRNNGYETHPFIGLQVD
jgi:hypothetical protein